MTAAECEKRRRAEAKDDPGLRCPGFDVVDGRGVFSRHTVVNTVLTRGGFDVERDAEEVERLTRIRKSQAGEAGGGGRDQNGEQLRVLEFMYTVTFRNGHVVGMPSNLTSYVDWLPGGHPTRPSKWNKCGLARADKRVFAQAFENFNSLHRDRFFPPSRPSVAGTASESQSQTQTAEWNTTHRHGGGAIPIPESFYAPHLSRVFEELEEGGDGAPFFVKIADVHKSKGTFPVKSTAELTALLSDLHSSGVPDTRLLVQRGVHPPHLLGGKRKWHFRVFALVPDWSNPYVLFCRDCGTVIRASEEFGDGSKKLSLVSHTDLVVNSGRQRDSTPYAALARIVGREVRDRVWNEVERAVTLGVLANVGHVDRGHKTLQQKYCGPSGDCSPECFNVIAADFMLDSQSNVFLLEIMGASNWLMATAADVEKLVGETLQLLRAVPMDSASFPNHPRDQAEEAMGALGLGTLEEALTRAGGGERFAEEKWRAQADFLETMFIAEAIQESIRKGEAGKDLKGLDPELSFSFSWPPVTAPSQWPAWARESILKPGFNAAGGDPGPRGNGTRLESVRAPPSFTEDSLFESLAFAAGGGGWDEVTVARHRAVARVAARISLIRGASAVFSLADMPSATSYIEIH
uniref:Uncharacterized protein n=1 Tax=Chromera velia CCMP2878 TaxID=1169474 RepID=A0A0G4I7A6_9ALVE|eukprot:Cvel_1921.t1-p1 / transcript=Cvel_1921.t1 / gene=Cvel_1921 / organism=Chromera_velia_CCMP2878 / gene_product=hypothetical protein / transcript_product=hypothetical protein / location=Cvel_scaffold72:29599-34391(+) / protein_length=632 / sequence_SO=supercontig / SO=protein_coding / is_pseudo=false